MSVTAPTISTPKRDFASGCAACTVDHFSSCSTGVLGQATIAAREATRRAVDGKDNNAQLSPQNAEDIQYVYDTMVVMIQDDLKLAKPTLGVTLPTDANEIAKIKAGIPNAIRQGQAVYVVVAMMLDKQQKREPLRPDLASDVQEVFGRIIDMAKGVVPDIETNRLEGAFYRMQIKEAMRTWMKHVPKPA